MANVIGTLYSQIKVYVDEQDLAANVPDPNSVHRKEDVSGWYQTSLRQGVTDGRNESSEFIAWKDRCIGRVSLQSEIVDTSGNYTKIPKWHVYFEKQEDLVSYLLTFDELITRDPIDIAAYYCPYIPLSIYNVVVNSATVHSTTTFMTRYGHISTGGSELD